MQPPSNSSKLCRTFNSFSCLGFAPWMDWFYLPAFLGRTWKWERSMHLIYPVIYLLYCFLASTRSLQGFCLSFFVFYLHFRHKADASDISTEKPEPMLHVSTQGLLQGAGWGGRRVPTSIPSTPDCQPALAVSLAIWKAQKFSHSNFVLLSGFAKF